MSPWIINLIIILVSAGGGAVFYHLLKQSKWAITTDRIIVQAQVETLTQSETDGFIIIDSKGIIVHLNDALLKMFNYQNIDQLKGQNVKLLMPSDVSKNHDQYMHNYEKTGVKTFLGTERQVLASKQDGNTFHINLSVNEVNIANKRFFVSIVRDVSNEVQMYRQILHQRNKFETLFDYCPDGILYVNDDHQVLDVNESFAKLYGQHNDKIVGQQLRNLYQTNTPELLRIEQLLLEMGEKWQEGETLARLTTDSETPITVVISHQQTHEQNETRYIYVVRDISQELDLIAHITEKNHTQELSEALVKMGYWRYDTNNKQLWCSNQIFKILHLPSNSNNLVDIEQLQQLIDTQQHQTAKDAIQNSINDFMPLSLSLTVKTVDNQQRHIVIKGICETSYGKLTAMYGVFQDITERLNQQESLRLAKDRLEQSQAIANIGNWHWDLASNQVLWSDLATPMLGSNKGQTSIDFDQYMSMVHPEDQANVQQAIDRCILQSEKYDIEHRVIWKNKTTHWLHQQGDVIRDDNGVAVSMIGVVQDITERKQKESQLHQFKQIIESSEQAVSVFNAKGQLLYANPAHARIYRLPLRQELCLFNDLVAPEYHNSALSKQVETALKAQGHWSGEIESKRFDHSLFPSHFAISQFEDLSNKMQFRFAISYDISAEKQQQQMLNEAKIKAEAANRAKSEFLSSMSHELRTPLNAVLGFTQLLKRQKEVEFTDRINSNIDAIHQAGDHLLVLINGVLDLAKIESGNAIADITDVNIKDVITDAVHMISPVAQENGLSLLTAQGSKIPVLYTEQLVPVVKGDFIMLKQALLNYLSNATKYNKPDGVIFITVDINRANQTARITVSDNGIGISHENLNKLFTPFNRLGLENTNIQGTGIGLVITKKNIEALGGTVGVTSKANVGSSFWFEVPYKALIPIESMPCLDDALPSLREAVLYIDDKQASTELMQGFFEHMPELDLYTSVNVQLATIYAAQYQPKLILISDKIVKQDVTAINELVQRTNLREHHIVVIGNVLAGEGALQEDALQKGQFDGQLNKPVSFDALQTTLRQYQLISNERISHE